MPSGYVLRIAREEWLAQVFDNAIYFTSMRRRWAQDQIVLFVHRMAAGDSFVGYGVILRACESEVLPREERLLCEEGRWRTAIELSFVKKFDRPVLVRDAFQRGLKLRGRCLQGLRLGEDEVDAVISAGEGR